MVSQHRVATTRRYACQVPGRLSGSYLRHVCVVLGSLAADERAAANVSFAGDYCQGRTVLFRPTADADTVPLADGATVLHLNAQNMARG